MVVLSEVSNMFWGVTLDGGKHYTQTVERSFHISMAALEPSAASGGKLSKQPVSVMIQHDKAEFMLCTLEQGRVYQQSLDLNFTEGEEVTFFLNGTGIVHLTGYLVEDESMMSDMEDMDEADFSMDDVSDSDSAPALVGPDDSDDDEDESPAITVSAKKRKKDLKEKPGKKKAKVVVVEEGDDSEDDDDSDDDDDVDGTPFALADFDEDDDDDDDDFDEEDDDELDNEIVKQITAKKVKPVSTPKSGKKSAANTPKAEVKSTPQKQDQNGSENTESATKKKKKKNKDKKDDQEKTPGPGGDAKKSKTPKKAVLAGGTISEEVKVGHGPEAKHGKMVHVYYKGTLGKTGKQFDSCTGGKPFRFRLGKKEVISGWDNGVVGMKVGGTRKLIVPPPQGYGNKRTGPIPPNSTLVFEIELKAVS